MFKRIFFPFFAAFSIFILCLVSPTTRTFSHAQEASSIKTKSVVSYTFIQTTSKVTIEPVKETKDLYRMTIKNVSPFVSYFSDRPNRFTGSMSLNKFLQEWQGFNSFTLVPPNVSISGSKTNKGFNQTELTFVTELTNPHYDGKKNTMSYDIKFISAKPNMSDSPLILHNVTLFFDGATCPSCCC